MHREQIAHDFCSCVNHVHVQVRRNMTECGLVSDTACVAPVNDVCVTVSVYKCLLTHCTCMLLYLYNVRPVLPKGKLYAIKC